MLKGLSHSLSLRTCEILYLEPIRKVDLRELKPQMNTDVDAKRLAVSVARRSLGYTDSSSRHVVLRIFRIGSKFYH